jgi:hypothetical protein
MCCLFRLDFLFHPDPFKRCYLDRCDYSCALVHAHGPFLAVVFLGNAGQNAEQMLPKRRLVFRGGFGQNRAG